MIVEGIDQIAMLLPVMGIAWGALASLAGALISKYGSGRGGKTSKHGKKSAIDTKNEYMLMMAKLRAQDPAHFIKAAMKGATEHSFWKHQTKGKGGGAWAAKSPQQQALLQALGNMSNYGLTQHAGGIKFNDPGINPVTHHTGQTSSIRDIATTGRGGGLGPAQAVGGGAPPPMPVAQPQIPGTGRPKGT